jgi:hypothetical protein
LLLAAGFEEGTRNKQLMLDRSIGTTTPDVFYRADYHDEDEGICIYLDGLSEHLHGNSQTAEQDRRIRDWLRNNGYEVIEIAVSELDDQNGMSRHFRRLAGYLGDRNLREKVRSDPSWFERARETVEEAARFTLRIVRPGNGERYITCVPLVPLKAAAGAFGDPQFIEEGDWDWVEIDTGRSLRTGMFMAQVTGHSMEPLIPDGSYCLFYGPVVGSRQGKVVLVQLRDEVDPETGERYTVKRYESEKVEEEGGTWRHVRINLLPVNSDYESIELSVEDEGQVLVIAELVEVLG